MNSLILLLALVAISAVHAVEDPLEAMRECGNVHHLEFQGLPNAEAVYSNDHCTLKCLVGNKTLSNDAVNEGFPCPTNPNGLCHVGQCQETHHSENEALRECGNLHHIDLHTANGQGSFYSNNHCNLRCVVSGVVISMNNLNEGLPCPQNTAGHCHNGYCVREEVTHLHRTTQKIVVHTIPPTVHPTTVHPGPSNPLTTVQPTTSKVPSNTSQKIEDLYIRIMSADLHDKQGELVMTACVEETTSPNFHPSSCHSPCYSTVIHPEGDKPVWNKVCEVKGHFEERHNIIIALLKHSVNARTLGSMYRTLGVYEHDFHTILRQHNLATVPRGRHTIEGDFPITYNGVQIGTVKLYLYFTLNHL